MMSTAPVSFRIISARGSEVSRTSLCRGVSAGEAMPTSSRALWREATGIELIDDIGIPEILHIFVKENEASALPGAPGLAAQGY